jgi:hypothetical protein
MTRASEQFEASTEPVTVPEGLKATLERVLTKARAPDWDLECRGVACKLEILDPSSASTWLEDLQADEDFLSQVTGVAFSASRPSVDTASGKGVLVERVYWRLRSTGGSFAPPEDVTGGSSAPPVVPPQ